MLDDTLKGFRPATSLDAGALLYEAGRASVPPPWRAWGLVGLLALTQALTLLALLVPVGHPSEPAPAARRVTPPGADAPGSPGQADEVPVSPWHRPAPSPPPADDVPPDPPSLRAIDLTTYE